MSNLSFAAAGLAHVAAFVMSEAYIVSVSVVLLAWTCGNMVLYPKREAALRDGASRSAPMPWQHLVARLAVFVIAAGICLVGGARLRVLMLVAGLGFVWEALGHLQEPLGPNINRTHAAVLCALWALGTAGALAAGAPLGAAAITVFCIATVSSRPRGDLAGAAAADSGPSQLRRSARIARIARQSKQSEGYN